MKCAHDVIQSNKGIIVSAIIFEIEIFYIQKAITVTISTAVDFDQF